MSFLTIPFFVRWNMECSRTRQESQSKFADHQKQDDISQDICWINFFSPNNESLLWNIVYCETLVFLPYIPKQKVTSHAFCYSQEQKKII